MKSHTFYYKSRENLYQVLQFIWKLVSILQVTREFVHGTTSHAHCIWFIITIVPNYTGNNIMQQLNRQLPSSSYNHNTLTTLGTLWRSHYRNALQSCFYVSRWENLMLWGFSVYCGCKMSWEASSCLMQLCVLFNITSFLGLKGRRRRRPGFSTKVKLS